MHSVAGESTASSDPAPLIAVTGANGFLGSHVVAELRARGWPVRACVRKLPPPARDGVEWIALGDLGPDTNWDAALRGVQAVIHCAGLAHIGIRDAARREAEFIRVNVDGTGALARAASRSSVRRLVFVSSIGVNGTRTSGRPFVSEDAPGPRSVYARSKLLAEQALLEVAKATGLETVIVRPTLIVGRNAPGNLSKLTRLITKGVWLPFGAVRNRRSLVSAEYLAELLVSSAIDERVTGRILLAAEQPALSTVQIVTALGQGVRRAPRLLSIPVSWLRLLAVLTGYRSEMSSLCDSLEVDGQSAAALLGVFPRVPIERRIVAAAGGDDAG
jgi:nucleoside-diphosphate-sugar epimerase